MKKAAKKLGQSLLIALITIVVWVIVVFNTSLYDALMLKRLILLAGVVLIVRLWFLGWDDADTAPATDEATPEAVDDEEDTIHEEVHQQEDTGTKPLEQKRIRREELKQLEERYKAERNYQELVSVYDELIALGTAYGLFGNVLFKKMYCLARLGRIEEVSTLMKGNSGLLSFSMGQNELYRAVTLLSFFTTNEHNIFVIRQTLVDWLNDTETAQQVKDIVFDYEAVLPDLTIRIAAFKAFS